MRYSSPWEALTITIILISLEILIITILAQIEQINYRYRREISSEILVHKITTYKRKHIEEKKNKYRQINSMTDFILSIPCITVHFL
jgi:hypothetical protein